ncbi:ABC transporter permease [Clostridiales bacterium COT073_COT-073]|nr:ABC transporter permease [Clostridiales bacterium COT073_COT-073]
MSKRKYDVSVIYKKFGIYLVLLALLVISSIISPVFLSKANIMNLLTQISVVTIISCGITMLIIENMTDLSGGSVVALTGCLCVGTYKMLIGWGCNIIVAGVICMGTAMVCGFSLNLLSGMVITHYRAPAFIVTLAMSQMARGLVYLYTGGQPIYGIEEIAIIGQGKIGNILPFSVIIMIVIVSITWVVLNKTRFGRYVYAIGGNREAAVASGVNVNRTVLKTYMLHGIFVGIAGVLYMTRINSGQPAEGVNLEFDAITAAIIGGTSFSGGIGTVQGTICGSIIIGVIKNILNLLSVQSYYQQIITGMIIVIAVILDIKTKMSGK